jgi:hypothetical protein
MPFAYVRFIEFDGYGRPIDPGYGVGEGGRPDQGLPGYPGRPSQGLPRPPWEGGGDPGYGVGEGRPGHLPARPGRPVDPGYGVGEDGAGQLPIFPLEPGQGLPGGGGEHPGQGLPAEPGTVWPPLPGGGTGFHGRAVLGCYAWYNGQMHHHFVVVTIPEVPPERPPVDPGYGVEGQPPVAGQPLPPGRPGYPVRPDQGLPGGGVAAGQLPAAPQRDPRLAR